MADTFQPTMWNLKMMTPMNKTEPSWTELGRLVREMSWSERREFFRMALLPWPNRRDNIRMVAWGSVFTAAHVTAAIAIVSAITKTYDVVPAMFLSFAIGVTFTNVILQMWTRELVRGVRARHAEMSNKMMAEMQKVVDAMGAEILEKLKAATGREHIDNNPISMTAANLDLIDKSRTPKRVDNPLQAALEDRLHPNDLIRDDDDESAS